MNYGGGHEDSSYSGYSRGFADWYDDVYAGVFDSIGHGYGVSNLEDKYRDSASSDSGKYKEAIENLLNNHNNYSYGNSSEDSDTHNHNSEYQNSNGNRDSIVFLSATLCDLGGCRIVTAKPRSHNEAKGDLDDIASRDKMDLTVHLFVTINRI
ncbi:uncharacterized protein LOC122247358 [Penaeus japonicus]|uniref:uncharacterized protein LOC122247358 n=1 Tax=Penaeus japonicus TaxID=27405 RepID=UPI001C7147A6|nr:uncharacterized protein LOC122247358 [Penaeus japonicus]